MKPSSLLTGALGAISLLLLSGTAWSQCEVAKLRGTGTAPFDYFGKSIHMDGNRVVVGAYATNNSRPGFAFVYGLRDGVWNELARLVPKDGGAGDEFGNSVGISESTVVVGSEFNDENGNNAGAIYVFDSGTGRFDAGTKLTPLDAQANHHFGEYVAIDGDTIVVGTRQDATRGNNSGAAYVFERTGGTWAQTAKLIGSDTERNDLLSDTVAIDGGRIVVGSYRNDASGGKSGAAYIFEKVGGKWTEMAKLVASDAAGELSKGIGIDGDRIVLGARLDNTMGSEAGAAFIFEKTPGGWVETAKLLPSTAGAGDWSGEAVAVQGDLILVSGHHHSEGAFNTGVAYLFENIAGEWVETRRLMPRDLASLDEFSHALTMDGTTAILTSPFDNFNVGSAYVFDLTCGEGEPGTIVSFGEEVGGSNVGTLSSSSVPAPGVPLEFQIDGLSGDGAGILWLSLESATDPFAGGTLLADFYRAPVKLFFQMTDGRGQVAWTLPEDAGGVTAFAQAGALDATQPQGIGLTQGLEIRVGQ